MLMLILTILCALATLTFLMVCIELIRGGTPEGLVIAVPLTAGFAALGLKCLDKSKKKSQR